MMSDGEQQLRNALELEKPIGLNSTMPGKFFEQQDDGRFVPCLPCFVALILRIEGDSVFVKRLTPYSSKG
jgi:hypothetical protein